MKQKTLWHYDVDKLDEEVNTFEETHKVKFTQCYSSGNNHYRVLFYEV